MFSQPTVAHDNPSTASCDSPNVTDGLLNIVNEGGA